MRANFGGSGLHWRVLPVRRPGARLGMWQVYRRAWDHWEAIEAPYLSQNGAMTRANHLAKLHRG